jgi:hypothetical protein
LTASSHHLTIWAGQNQAVSIYTIMLTRRYFQGFALHHCTDKMTGNVD